MLAKLHRCQVVSPPTIMKRAPKSGGVTLQGSVMTLQGSVMTVMPGGVSKDAEDSVVVS